MNARVREAVEALRCLDALERLQAIQAVTRDVRTTPQRRGTLRVMWWIRGDPTMAPDQGGRGRPRRRTRAGSGGPADDFGMPGGDTPGNARAVR